MSKQALEALMQIFHFNVTFDTNAVVDGEGGSFVNFAAAKAEAFGSLCSLAAQDMEQGRQIRVRRIDITSSTGEILGSVSLAEVLATIVPFEDDAFFSEVARQVSM
jgi:hypothetical protein